MEAEKKGWWKGWAEFLKSSEGKLLVAVVVIGLLAWLGLSWTAGGAEAAAA